MSLLFLKSVSLYKQNRKTLYTIHFYSVLINVDKITYAFACYSLFYFIIR